MVVSVVWFRRDLRLRDHPALAEAASQGSVAPLYVIDPKLWQTGAARQNFLVASLRSLGSSMDRQLVIRYGDPRVVVPSFAAEVGAREVFVSEDHTPYGRSRDEAVAQALSAERRHLRAVGSNYAVAPGRVRKDDGNPYAVFTPFLRAWHRIGWEATQGAPTVEWFGDPKVASEGYPTLSIPSSLDAGEGEALARFEAFRFGPLARYDHDRDFPAINATSGLGPYLRFGVVHPRQLLADLGDSRSHTTFRSELAWRDFYADVLYHRPLSAWQNLQTKMNAIPVDTDEAARERFGAWQRGDTGFPIVDAGMRQLRSTGFMHNRVRMVVASFLVKDLHLPWQWGARHFMSHLLDGDLASNNHGWQWAAGTGTDAAPYFRVFNPVSQSERFDPGGEYLRRFVPEIAGLSDKEIHAPWQSKRGVPLGYTAPMVDHAVEREEALRRYGIVSGRSGTA